MGSDEEQRLHAEYNKQVAAVNERMREKPNDWALFFECGEQLDDLNERFNAELDALPKSKRK